MAESYPNGKKNTVGKGEIARYEQFLLFPQCFQKACFPGASKGVVVWEWVKLPNGYFLFQTDLKNTTGSHRVKKNMPASTIFRHVFQVLNSLIL